MQKATLLRTGLSSLAVAALLAGLTGCSQDTEAVTDAERSGLLGALELVPDSASVRKQSILYYDVPAARELVATKKKLYRSLDGYGMAELGGFSAGSPEETWGFTEKQVRVSLSVGNDTGVETGDFDRAAMAKALERQGYHSAKTDGGLRLTKPGAQRWDLSAQRRVRASGGTHPGLSDPGHSLAGNSAYKELGDCLGEVYAAATYPGRATSAASAAGLPVASVVGARAEKGKTPSEKLCALAPDRKTASTLVDRLREKTAKGQMYAGSTVTLGDGERPMVTMTWTSTTASGRRPMDHLRTLVLGRALLGVGN